MKTVTIDPSLGTDAAKSPTNTSSYSNGYLRPDSTIPKLVIPRYLLQPGQDGYLTPTIEDFEKTGQPSSHQEHIEVVPPSPFSHLPPSSLGASASTGPSHDVEKVEKLEWKRRIKHFTWTFFSMTMATGGIANILYAGMFD